MILIAILALLLVVIEPAWEKQIQGVWIRLPAGAMIGAYNLNASYRKETAFVIWIDYRPRFGIGWVDGEFNAQTNPRILPE